MVASTGGLKHKTFISKSVIRSALIAIALGLVGCESKFDNELLLAIWVQNSDPILITSLRNVRQSVCQARLVLPGEERPYQEWAVPKKAWSNCQRSVATLTSPIQTRPMNWLYTIATGGRSLYGKTRSLSTEINWPDYRARYLHLTGHALQLTANDTAEEVPWGRTAGDVHVPLPNGELLEGRIVSVSVDAKRKRYLMKLALPTGNGGTIVADASGYSGYFTAGGALYEIALLDDGTQWLAERPSPQYVEHAPGAVAGELFTAAESSDMSRAAATLMELTTLRQSEMDADRLDRRGSCYRSYDGREPNVDVDVNMLLLYPPDAERRRIDMQMTDVRNAALDVSPRNWSIVANTLAQEVTLSFSRQAFHTRVNSVGALPTGISADYWTAKVGKEFLESADQIYLYKALWRLAYRERASSTSLSTKDSEIAEAVRRDDRLTKEFEDFQNLVVNERKSRGADIVVIVEGDDSRINTKNIACGESGQIRAQLGTAIAVVRLDCAWANASLTHEVGHLLGARHERQQINQSCDVNTPLANDASECDEDRTDFGVGPDRGPPASRVNRAFYDRGSDTYTGTVMTSGYWQTEAFHAIAGLKQPWRRVEYWADARSDKLYDGLHLSDGCCNDGFVADEYAFNCVSRFVPHLKEPARQEGSSDGSFSKGLLDAPPSESRYLERLQSTVEFRLGEPRAENPFGLPAREQLEIFHLGGYLRERGIRRVYVEAYGDSVKSCRINNEIARRRALAVALELCESIGDAEIGVAAYGKAVFAVPEPDEVLEQRNRRAVVSWPSEGLSTRFGKIKLSTCESLKVAESKKSTSVSSSFKSLVEEPFVCSSARTK